MTAYGMDFGDTDADSEVMAAANAIAENILPPSPDAGSFDSPGDLVSYGGNMGMSPDRYAFSTLIAKVLMPQMETEFEPFKTAALIRPKQKKALETMLTLFRIDYAAEVTNRFGLIRLLEREAARLAEDAGMHQVDEIRKAEELALKYTNLRSRLNHLARLPKYGIEKKHLLWQQSQWDDIQGQIIDDTQNISELTLHARGFYYYRIYWLDIIEWIGQDRLDRKPFKDYTHVKDLWAEGNVDPGKIVSQMPWAWQCAYQMQTVSLSSGQEFRNLFRDIFTQTNSTIGGDRYNKLRNRGQNWFRKRQGGGNNDDDN